MNIIKQIFPLPTGFPFDTMNSTILPQITDDLLYHWHECLEISFVISGQGNYYTNGNVFPMEPGDIILFNNIQPHAWSATSDEPLIQRGIIFDPVLIWAGQENLFDSEYLKPFDKYCTNFANKLPSNHAITKKIYHILEEVFLEFAEKPPAFHLMIKAKLLEVMTHLIRNFQKDEKSVEIAKNKKHKLMRLQKVIEYIHLHYDDTIMIEDVAKLINMNASYFSSFFKATIGSSFIEYLSTLRIENAEQMIKHTDDTLTSIAFSCGFNSMSNFYRTYKKLRGENPSNLR